MKPQGHSEKNSWPFHTCHHAGFYNMWQRYEANLQFISKYRYQLSYPGTYSSIPKRENLLLKEKNAPKLTNSFLKELMPLKKGGNMNMVQLLPLEVGKK